MMKCHFSLLKGLLSATNNGGCIVNTRETLDWMQLIKIFLNDCKKKPAKDRGQQALEKKR